MKNLLLVLLCGLHGVAFSDDLPPLVDVIQQRYNALHTLTAHFDVTTTLAALHKNLRYSGGLAFAKGGKLRIEYGEEPPRQYVSDGTRLWVYTDGDAQYMEMALGKAGLPKEALTFLTGFGNLREQYAVQPDGPTDAQGAQTFTLTPKKKTDYDSLSATFSAQGLLTALTIHQRSGNTTRYTFSQLAIDPVLAPQMFTFTPPEGVSKVE